MLNLRHSQHGVTLVELIIAMAIFGILVMFAAPGYSTWIQNQQTRAAAESILNGLQLARSTAVNNNTQALFTLCGLPASSWEVQATSVPAACGGAFVTAGGSVVQSRSSQEGSSNAQVAVTPVGATTVTFNSLGRVVDVPPVTTISVSNPNGGSRPLNITLSAGGNTRMCDPSLAAGSDPRAC